jgi:hypothetical protein
MPRQFRILSGQAEIKEQTYRVAMPEEKLRHFRNVSSSILRDAQDTWGDIWDQLQGSVTHGAMVTPEAGKGFVPECGWPEFLEKMWELRHYLDYARRYCEGRE